MFKTISDIKKNEAVYIRLLADFAILVEREDLIDLLPQSYLKIKKYQELKEQPKRTKTQYRHPYLFPNPPSAMNHNLHNE